MTDSRSKAFALLEAIQSALTAGVRHYNRAGLLLTNAAAVLECLLEEGEVRVSDPDAVEWRQ